MDGNLLSHFVSLPAYRHRAGRPRRVTCTLPVQQGEIRGHVMTDTTLALLAFTPLVLAGVLLIGFRIAAKIAMPVRSEEHTSELQSRPHLVCRLLLEKKN